jgi:L-seryl-tRNA(Ser) seleniumtransferase
VSDESRLPKLPSIGDLLSHPSVQDLVGRIHHSTLARRAAGYLDELRTSATQRAQQLDLPTPAQIADRFARRLLGERCDTSMRINATGVVLGPPGLAPPLAEAAVQAVLHVSSDYAQPESLRQAISRELCEQTRAQAALVVSSYRAALHLVEVTGLRTDPQLQRVEDAPLAGLYDPAQEGLDSVPTWRDRLAQGASIVLGDAAGLVGGPALGILLGQGAWIDRLAHHPLTEVLRPGLQESVALAATLPLYRRGAEVKLSVPIWQLLTAPLANLEQRAQRLAPQLAQAPGISSARACQVSSAWAVDGNGTARHFGPSWAIALQGESEAPDELAARLGRLAVGVEVRLAEGEVLLDLRSVFPRWDHRLVSSICGVEAGTSSPDH